MDYGVGGDRDEVLQRNMVLVVGVGSWKLMEV